MTGRSASVAAVGRGVRVLELLSRPPDGLSPTGLAVVLQEVGARLASLGGQVHEASVA
jgi:hypothetical protein